MCIFLTLKLVCFSIINDEYKQQVLGFTMALIVVAVLLINIALAVGMGCFELIYIPLRTILSKKSNKIQGSTRKLQSLGSTVSASKGFPPETHDMSRSSPLSKNNNTKMPLSPNLSPKPSSQRRLRTSLRMPARRLLGMTELSSPTLSTLKASPSTRFVFPPGRKFSSSPLKLT